MQPVTAITKQRKQMCSKKRIITTFGLLPFFTIKIQTTTVQFFAMVLQKKKK